MRTYTSYSDARAHLKDVLDAAEAGRSALIQRDSHASVVLDASRLRNYLAAVVPQRAEVVAEDGGWSVFIPGLPLAADGSTFPEAVTEMVETLREYAEDWAERLHSSSNHASNWGIVQFISLSTDAQLEDWLTGAAA